MSGNPKSWWPPFAVALGTTAGVAALSYGLPPEFSATAVGMAFMAATYFVALRGDDGGEVRHYGLALGGLLEPKAIDPKRLLRDGARAAGYAVVFALVFFPPFWLGYVYWWPVQTFHAAPLPPLGDEVLGQLLVIALPEEAFYRGYLQRAFDDVWKPKLEILGAHVGPGIVVSAALFAVGHVITEFHPNRLAVFFPALLFGWLRARTGGIGASLTFHALCNLFASYLARSYGLSE